MNKVLGCDIGNGYGYISLLLNPNDDPISLFPANSELTNIGMPTTAYVKPPDGDDIIVFRDGKAAEKQYKNDSERLICNVQRLGGIKTKNLKFK